MNLQRTGRHFCSTLMMVLASAAVTATEGELHLSGVLVSNASRVALINGELAHEGDRIAGAEIVAIREGEVHIRVDDDRLVVKVGALLPLRGNAYSASRSAAMIRNEHAIDTADLTSRAERVDKGIGLPSPVAGEYRLVAYGESLSVIASEYAGDEATIDQVMMALFDGNPDAFSGNINLLFEGAVLKVPSVERQQLMSAVDAAIEVQEQGRTWRGASSDSMLQANNAVAKEYGPVENGETLSEIAEKFVGNHLTLDQLMLLLYRSNPHAFGNSVHLLRSGATLSIPDFATADIPGKAVASAIMLEHARIWRKPGSPRTPDKVTAEDFSTAIASRLETFDH